MSEPVEHRIGVASIFGAKTRQPLVELTIPPVLLQDGTRVQMSPEEASALGLNLLAGSEGAISDGFIVDFFVREMELSMEQAAAVMLRFRGYRTRRAPEGT